MQYWADVLNQGLIIAVFAVSLNVILGYAGQLSIAPAGLGGVGAYAAGYLSAKHGWDFGPALAVGIGAALAVGTALGVPALRLGQDYLILLTLAFATVITGVLAAIPAFGGSYGLLGIKLVDLGGGPLIQPTSYLLLTAPICALCCLFCWRLAASPFGRVLRGIREDEDATQALGKNVVAYKILTFSLTSAVAGVGGVLMVYYDQIASPSQFNFSATTIMVAAAIVGGMGNLAGSFVGAISLSFIGPILQKVVRLNPDSASLWQLLIYGALLILVMRIRPGGLIPEGTSLTSALHRRRRAEVVTAESRLARVIAIDGAAGDRAAVDRRHALPQPAPATPRLSPSPRTEAAPLGSSDSPVLVARGLAKRFGGIRAVEGLDLDLHPGRITALVGPNGAGKTTVFNLVTGRIKPDAGTVVLRGRDITNLPPHKVAALGLVRSFQDVRLLGRLTLLDNVRLGVPGQPGEHLASLFLRPRLVRQGERVATRERARVPRLRRT